MALRTFRRYEFSEALRRGLQLGIATARIKGRGFGLSLNGYHTIQEFLQVHKLNVLSFENINSGDAMKEFREGRFDIFAAGAFSQILGRELLAIPTLGALNVHLSLLPKYRGPSACYWVVKNKERMTGVTVHFMDEKIDTGDITLRREIPVYPGESPSQLELRLSPIGAELLLETISQIEAGTVCRVPQRQEEATYYSFPKFRMNK